MKTTKRIPYITTIISLATVLYSFYVNNQIAGSYFGKIKIIDLEKYGAYTLQHLIKGEFWRLITAQLIHVKQSHMLFNVVSFFLLGITLEKYIGAFRFFIIWFISGTLGSLVSTFTVEYPWNLASGASQAIFGIAAFALILIIKKIDSSLTTKLLIAFAITPALILDILYAHHPKPGHIVAFTVGLCFGIYFVKKINMQKLNLGED